MTKKTTKSTEKEDIAVEILEIGQGEVRFNILGTSPLICHRYPFKAWQELVLPSRKENRAALEQTLKHVPIEEYRESLYRNRDPKRATMFHLPNGMFAGALTQAGVDVPGAARATLERLTRVADVSIDLYGVPQIFCAMVRNSGINRTPDVRTRPIFPQWACRVTVRYCRPQLTERNISNLMGAAGLICGIGDWRGERGGPYGAFKVVGDDDREFLSIIKNQNRKPQASAFDQPAYFDGDTADLLTWFAKEVKRREQDGQKPRRQRANGGDRPKTRVHVVDGNENYFGAES